MTMETEKIQQELKWVRVQEPGEMTFLEKLKSKGIFGFLVPAGCLITASILLSGIYQMTQRNSKKQQLLMRYRVASQGITILLATIGIFMVPLAQSKPK